MSTRWLFPAICVAAAFPQLSQAKDLDVVLRLKARVPMERLAHDVTDPQSPRFRQFYSPEEIRQLAAPSDAEYSALLGSLRAKGFRVVSESKSHLLLTIRGAKESFESTFATKLQPLEDGRHRALLPAKIPAELAPVASVIGLDSTRSSRPHLKFRESGPTGRDTGTGLQPDYIHSAYGFNPIYQSGLSGKGQQIAIATYDGFYPIDVSMYYAFQNIKPAPQVDVVEFNGHANVNDDSAMETAVDAEFSGMIAPGAKIHVFTSAHNDDAGEVQLFTAILDDNRAKIANYSWGDCEADVTAQHFQDMNTVFARAVAQGVNITVASGDWGAFGCPQSAPGAGKLNADWPAANPYVLAVGGTFVTGGDNGEVKENAWDSTGGGISTVFPLPEWQKALGSPYLKRSFPDVAFNADPGSGEPAYVHYMNVQQWIQIGGTSISAPQWSGFLALVGEARTGLPNLGYLNPVIYSMSAADRTKGFHDVTTGDNGGYKAGAGWDPTTGWGSMRAYSLLELLRSH